MEIMHISNNIHTLFLKRLYTFLVIIRGKFVWYCFLKNIFKHILDGLSKYTKKPSGNILIILDLKITIIIHGCNLALIYFEISTNNKQNSIWRLLFLTSSNNIFRHCGSISALKMACGCGELRGSKTIHFEEYF